MRDTSYFINRFKSLRRELDQVIAELEAQGPEKEWISQREASQLLGVCDATMSNWVKGGRFLPQDISCIGSKTYINRDAITCRRFNNGGAGRIKSYR